MLYLTYIDCIPSNAILLLIEPHHDLFFLFNFSSKPFLLHSCLFSLLCFFPIYQFVLPPLLVELKLLFGFGMLLIVSTQSLVLFELFSGASEVKGCARA